MDIETLLRKAQWQEALDELSDLHLRLRLLLEAIDDEKRADEHEVAGVAQFYVQWAQDELGVLDEGSNMKDLFN